MSTLTKAILLAAKAHDGQTDKGGNPYILHPIRLASKAKTTEESIVAVLHDVVEDSNMTLFDLKNEGFSSNVIAALDCLTRRADESYEGFIKRIKLNPLASKVKLLDLEDNCDINRIPQPTDADYARIDRYKKAIAELKF
ncbi:HD domain-containing protein [Paenibacillus sp. CGMCC 1.16610]|uniref:HD domain-containing protein n=2 Tax=Paenibacillus TaxID=44249 RepID=A0ABU6D8C8_9BACL|nr:MULTISPECIES: HD domain-containing protein [Paenibacillus]MBA2941411.1 HD domain-containing protein [Paenibacillus sp. CGMCC 1.16610]MCY9659843.1 HD domain-containing protein [Paenibacillus anseongense]MEB4793978.1 HD domain-containing protein [Paenibacillus chondroitinus]MVQ40230.1 HD domain-containing protein [Paenibacillus anseongense]